MSVFQSYEQESNRHLIVSTLYEIGNNAQQYFEKPANQGGGGLSYENWLLPDKYKKTSAGSFSVITKRKRVNISGIGTLIGRNGITNVRAIAKVDSSGIQVLIIN